jgi:hypothetical protein
MNKQTCSVPLEDIIFLNIKLECLLLFSQTLYAHISSQIQRVIIEEFSFLFLILFYFFSTCVFVILLHYSCLFRQEG